MHGLSHLILTAILCYLLAPVFLVMELRHREVIQLIISVRARILSHNIYLQSISCHSVADRIRMKDLSPCCHTKGAPLEVSVICLSQYCLSRDH